MKNKNTTGNVITTSWQSRQQIICMECGEDIGFLSGEAFEARKKETRLSEFGHEDCPALIKKKFN